MRLKDTKNTFIYIIEVGVLTDLNKYSSFRNSYKKLHDEGLLEDENVAFTQDLNKAKRYIEKYVRNGIQGTYGVLTIGKVEDDLIIEDLNGLLYDEDGFVESELENYLLENYLYEKTNSIIFSVYKDQYSIDYNTFE